MLPTMTDDAARFDPALRRARRVGYAVEYARRIERTDHTSGVDHYRLQAPGYQVSTIVTPCRYPGRGWHVSLLDHLTGDAVQYISVRELEPTLADARTRLARYMAEHLGAPA